LSTPKPFKTQADWRAWLEAHHDSSSEILLRLFKVHAAHRGLTYRQAVDEALCFGWIDGVVRRLDEDSFAQRYTPRRPGSIWSNINVGHVQRLIEEGRMTPAGLAAFEKRDAKRTGIYSFENRPKVLPPAMEKRFRANKTAWAFYQAKAPWYRRVTAYWILSAKKEETQQRRLETLIERSARGQVAAPILEKPPRKASRRVAPKTSKTRKA
jgi:uncharacterized protein YdeI (YjbR/CyaY-like superfamily)